MVGSVDFGVDFGARNLGDETLAHEEIVYPPAHISVASVAKMTPPRVMSITFRKHPE